MFPGSSKGSASEGSLRNVSRASKTLPGKTATYFCAGTLNIISGERMRK